MSGNNTNKLYDIFSFPAENEPDYLAYRYELLIKRVPSVGLFGIMIFAIFVMMDLMYLPVEVFQKTIPVRIGVNCPLVALCIFAALRRWPRLLFESLVFSAYLIAGLSIVFVIIQANKFEVYLPYDGIVLLLVFGYFLLGLNLVKVTIASLLISLSYVFYSYHYVLSEEQMFLNTFFLMTFNIMGIFSSYLQERSQRALFGHEKKLAQRQLQDQQEIESKSRLVATASHDLRQPLHAMNLMVDVLEDKLEGRPEARLTQKIKGSLKQVNSLLGSLLSYSQLEAGITEAKPAIFSLHDLLHELADEEKQRSAELGLAIIVECETTIDVRTDPVLLRRILRNLLENVFQHSGASTLRFGVSTEGQYAKIDVVDNGVGIPEEMQKTVFKEFTRGGNSNKLGLGIGLSIVRQLCNVLDVPISLEKSSHGCQFTLLVQLAKLQPRVEKFKKPVDANFDGLKVVIIENDETIRESMEALLENWGAEAIYVGADDVLDNKPEELLETGLIISDYHLDGKRNGVDVIKAFREEIRPGTPALLITADTSIDQEKIRQYGLDNEDTIIIHKPIQPAKLKVAAGLLLADSKQL